MAGGLLNLISVGNQNVFLTGNPKKTFFKCVYAKYTNFGLQRFRIDYEGSKSFNLNEKSHYSFKIKRHADLLIDTYLVVTLPHIWSPLFYNKGLNYIPYEFKWICDLGTQMIDEVVIMCGGAILQKLTGQYLTSLAQRDFNNTKKDLHDKMTGNIPRFNNPAEYGNNNGLYPNAVYSSTPGGSEPSIRGEKLYIPINFWYTLSSKMAFPLIAMQYNEIEIKITLRPIKELFTIRDVAETGINASHAHKQPNFNQKEQQFYTFIQTPPDNIITVDNKNTELEYTDKRTEWNADIHLICTYGFLGKEERVSFATKSHSYLIKEIYEYKHFNISQASKVSIDSLGMVATWMFFFRRNDAHLRNEWSNYTNWPYKKPPMNLARRTIYDMEETDCFSSEPRKRIYFEGFDTGQYESYYHKNIMNNMAILLDGKYRENVLESGVYNNIEKYIRTSGNAPDGLYVYNFCLQTDCFQLQPSGAINLSKFRNIEFEFTTWTPEKAEDIQYNVICHPETQLPVGIIKPIWTLFDYTYDLYIYEERYNMLNIESGNCGLMYAR